MYTLMGSANIGIPLVDLGLGYLGFSNLNLVMWTLIYILFDGCV